MKNPPEPVPICCVWKRKIKKKCLVFQQQRNIHRSNQIQNSQPQIQSQMQPQVQTHLQQIPQRGMNSTNSQSQMHTNQTQQILSNQSQQVHHPQNQHQQVIRKFCWWKSAKVSSNFFNVFIKTPFQFNYSRRKLDIFKQCLIMIQVQWAQIQMAAKKSYHFKKEM